MLKGTLSGVAVFVVLALAFIGGIGWKSHESAVRFDTPYQAVLLDNGQAYFGKLTQADSEHPILSDVYYIQQQQDPQTKEVRSILVRRGNEWHSPDHMVLEARHIIFMEPVGTSSKVAGLIAELQAKH